MSLESLYIFFGAIVLASSQVTPSCVTIGGPAPKSTPCIFPFIYGGITYRACAGDPAVDKKAERWCSTKVDAHGKHMEGTGNYGFCSSKCLSHYDDELQVPRVSVTPHGVTAVPAITREPKPLPKTAEKVQSGILNNVPKQQLLEPSQVDPGISHPSAFPNARQHEYPHEKYYHDPCNGKGACVPASQCPSPYRVNGTQCYLGHYSAGLCCYAILENPEGAQFLEKDPFEPSNGFNDFSAIPNSVINYAAEMGALFADNVTSTVSQGRRLRNSASGKSPAFSHFKFQRQRPGVLRLGRLAIIGGAAGKMLRAQLLGRYARSVRFNFAGADIRGTRLEADCPALPKCSANEKYRSFDGTCNNLQNTEWGMANTDVQRVVDNAYDDGLFIPRISSSSATSLPSARLVSNSIVSTEERPSNSFTSLIMSFGQFIDHDLTHIPNARVGEEEAVDCCGEFNQNLPEPSDLSSEEEIVCLPIRVPPSDPVYAGKQKCINFVRSQTSPPTRCQPGPFEQVNQITHWLDNSNVYGSGGNDSIEVRRYVRGLLNADIQLNGEELLPDSGDNLCRGSTHKCFLAGDLRVNEQPMLAVLHTIFLREHNRLARELVRINPHWLKNDEKIYQEARRILVAEWQHIIYNEWLPLILGEAFMEKFGLYPLSSGFSDDYSADFDPRITNAFATAAFRFGHSLIPENMRVVHQDELGNQQHEQVPLRDVFSDMDHLRRPKGIDALLRGMLIEKAERVDNHFVDSIVNFLFTDGNLGIDLIALNTQRGRDHGLPGYTTYRTLCNAGPAQSFEDLANNISPKNIEKLKSVYKNVEDIDLFIGMASEEPQGALVGNTYRCLIADQFARLKKGDRYFYDLAGQDGSFTEEQLYEIRKSSLSRIICDNAKHITEIQPLAFVAASDKNPLLPCNDRIGIPSVHLNYAWREGFGKPYEP